MKQLLNLVNMGEDTVVYNISFLNYKMTTDGNFEEIFEEDSLHKFSENYLRVFPRQVVLPPKEPQIIALQFRRNSEMIKGEYRSHLYLRSEVDTTALGNNSSNEDPSKLGIQLTPIYGITIPVIIRKEQEPIAVNVVNTKLKKDGDDYYVDFTITREGEFSFYGDVDVLCTDTNNKTGIVSRISGIALYTDIDQRHVRLKLDKNPEIDYQSGVLTIKLWTKSSNERKELNIYRVNN
jgi:hypothetical protein